MADRRMVPARAPRSPTKIGHLPEDILFRVMSHLTTRQAVHTCLLSQNWRNLWRSVPCFNVSIHEFEGRLHANLSDVSIEEFEGEDDGGDFEGIDMSAEEFEGEDDGSDFEGIGMSTEEFEGEDDGGDFEGIGMSTEEFEGEDDGGDFEGIGMSTEEFEGEDDVSDFEGIGMSTEEFEGEDDSGDFEAIGRRIQGACEVVFKRFVNRWLTLRNPVALDEFRLRYSCSKDDSSSSHDANIWISRALQWGARAVQVVNQYYPLELVPAVFTSSCLNRLHIGSAKLVPGFFNQLQMGCPSLEYLFLYDCIIMDLEISSSTLKVLILSDEVRISFDHNDQASISAPSLVSLSINYGLSGARLPILNNMPSLETASVSLKGDIKTCDANGIRQFLGGLSDVTSLDFCYWDRKLAMEKNFQWCPRFSKLVNLTLNTSCMQAEFYALIVFLQNSPNLKRLTLKLGQSDNYIAGELEDRSFTCEQLQIVEIKCWGTSEMLLRVTQLLHANGIRPDQMRISHRY